MDMEDLYERRREINLDELGAMYAVNGGYPEPPDSRYPLFPTALGQVEHSESSGDTAKRCYNCGHIGYDYPADKAYAPGHCYSPDGVVEFTRLSGLCEFCFDHLMREPEEDELDEADQDQVDKTAERQQRLAEDEEL